MSAQAWMGFRRGSFRVTEIIACGAMDEELE